MSIDEKAAQIAFEKTNERLSRGDLSGGMRQMLIDYEAAKASEQPDELLTYKDCTLAQQAIKNLMGEAKPEEFQKAIDWAFEKPVHSDEEFANLMILAEGAARHIDTLTKRESVEGSITLLPGAAVYYTGGWQPIETAPKDGTEIMVINGKERGYCTEEYQMGIAQWCVGGLGKEGWFSTVCCDGVSRFEPVAWMPKPKSNRIEDGGSNG